VTSKRTQTSSLIRSSDIIVGQGLFGNWMNESAIEISDDYDDHDDEYGTVDSNDEIDDELDEIERLFRDSDDDIGWDEGGTSFEDLSEQSMLDDNDWEERMFDESDLEEEGSADGHEHDYEIRKLDNAPSWDSMKSMSSSNDNSIYAISSSDVGRNFMISVQGVQNKDVEGITRWQLADDSVHKNPVKDIDTSDMEMKPTTLKQLRREIMPWDSVYSSRGGDRPAEKKDKSKQEDINQKEKAPKKQKKRVKKATKKPKPVTEDEIAAAELKRALKIERNKAEKLTKKERKEAAAERRKVDAPKLAAKIARLEGFINNGTARDAKLEGFVYKGTSSNLAVKRMRLKLKNLEAAAKRKERKLLKELTEGGSQEQ
jgi:septal ring-binding cell division protein DamX